MKLQHKQEVWNGNQGSCYDLQKKLFHLFNFTRSSLNLHNFTASPSSLAFELQSFARQSEKYFPVTPSREGSAAKCTMVQAPSEAVLRNKLPNTAISGVATGPLADSHRFV